MQHSRNLTRSQFQFCVLVAETMDISFYMFLKTPQVLYFLNLKLLFAVDLILFIEGETPQFPALSSRSHFPKTIDFLRSV